MEAGALQGAPGWRAQGSRDTSPLPSSVSGGCTWVSQEEDTCYTLCIRDSVPECASLLRPIGQPLTNGGGPRSRPPVLCHPEPSFLQPRSWLHRQEPGTPGVSLIPCPPSPRALAPGIVCLEATAAGWPPGFRPHLGMMAVCSLVSSPPLCRCPPGSSRKFLSIGVIKSSFFNPLWCQS